MSYTQEQIDRANQVDLEQFLRSQGEQLMKSGNEYRWKRHDSLTVRGTHDVLLHTSYSACITLIAPADEPLITMLVGSMPSVSALSIMNTVALNRSSTAMWMALSSTLT